MSLRKKRIIFFDDQCLICNSFVNFLLMKLKCRDFFYAPVDGESYKDLGLANEYNHIDAVIFFDKGKVTVKSEAVLEILKYTRLSWIRFILKLLPLGLLNFFYDFVAKTRYKIFGLAKTCPILPNELRYFFLK